MNHKFGIIDYFVLFGYIFGVAAIGASFYQRKTTTREYFLSGRTMSWIPVGISIVAADTSAITIMGTPAWSYKYNLELIWAALGPLIAAPLVIYIFVPFYSRLNLYTAYEYLEKRFNLLVRLITSLLFQFLRGIHVALAIYAPSLALSLVTDLPMWQCVLLMGVITTIYTSFGGMKAVIWTDLIQFCTICVGLVLVSVILLSQIDGGVTKAWQIAQGAQRLRILNLSFNPEETTSLWASLIGGTFISVTSLTTDQALLQRLFTTKSKDDCSQSVMLNAIVSLPMILILSLLGTLLFVFYQQRPDDLVGLNSSDAVLPFFTISQLPTGVSGLLIAAIFAASMAVMSAGINSLATATTVDYYQRIFSRNATPQQYARFGRVATVAWGLIATVLALYMDRLGDLALAYNRVSSFVSGPLFGIFFLGVLSRRTTSVGVLVGALAGTVAVFSVFSTTNWSFFYQGPIGVVVTVAVGYLTSLFMADPPATKINGLVHGYPDGKSNETDKIKE